LTLNLLLGSVLRIPLIIDLQSLDKNSGSSNLPYMIFSYNLVVLGSSKGRYPHTSANNIIPVDHKSTISAQYFYPFIISGAA